ncbi:hypothetical protein MRX96_047817 [Rhipicephalus microplus]
MHPAARADAIGPTFRISTADISVPSREDWYLLKWLRGMLEAVSRTDLLRHCIYLLESQEELKRNLTLQICPGGVIPDKYRRKWSEAVGAESHTIGAGSSWTLPVSVARAGSELRWDFCTSSGDLKFTVRFRSNNGARNADESRDLVLPTMVPCSRHEPHSGSLHCQEPGTYELVFDNSHSWLTRKEVSYSVKLLSPPTGTDGR